MKSGLSAFLKCVFLFFGVSGAIASNRTSSVDLWALSQSGSREEVERAIAAGADMNARNKQGETALLMAKKHNLDELADFLIKAGGE